jgi:UDPglucose 6-dehydrogenase
MKIGMIGMGFVGGTTAKILEAKHEMFFYDKYKSPYNCPENIQGLAKNSEVVFVCVPTPMKQSGEIDYSPIFNSLNLLNKKTREIKRNLEEILVVIRSTAVSGTTDKLAERYDFRFAFNPEFLREKQALEDMKNTNRIVIGANTDEDFAKLQQVYLPVFPNAKYIRHTRKEAEMVKYAANVMLTLQIAAANEIYKICEATGVNYNSVKETVLLDKRIGRNIHVPGPDGELGFGGKCFPKDLNALIYLARENNYRPYFLEEAWRLNEKLRKTKDWLDIPGAVSENKNNFQKHKSENYLGFPSSGNRKDLEENKDFNKKE